MRCWRWMEKISWTDRVRNEEVLHTVKKKMNMLHTITRRKTIWIGHIFRRNCLLKHIIKGKTGTRGRRRKVLDDFKKTKNVLETERGSTRSHTLENSLWKRLWTCRKTLFDNDKKIFWIWLASITRSPKRWFLNSDFWHWSYETTWHIKSHTSHSW